jgi:hypothetical protein
MITRAYKFQFRSVALWVHLSVRYLFAIGHLSPSITDWQFHIVAKIGVGSMVSEGGKWALLSLTPTMAHES